MLTIIASIIIIIVFGPLILDIIVVTLVGPIAFLINNLGWVLLAILVPNWYINEGIAGVAAGLAFAAVIYLVAKASSDDDKVES